MIMSDLHVPFFRPSITDDEIGEVVKCMKSGWLTTGPNAIEFEKEFEALYDDGIHAIAVNSATAALHLGLEAMGISEGDEVIVPTLTFTATAEVVRYLGANPIFVDIDRETFGIDLDAIRAAITPKTKAIMPVHFAGRACDMTALRALADEHGLKILDDAAHALPTHHNGKLIGDIGADATAFSFYANKTMTTGEGGMLVTRNADIAARARVMRMHGIDRDVFNRFTDTKASWMYDVVAPGFKYNLTDIAAAMGRVQLRKIGDFQAARERLVKRYKSAFADLPVTLPADAADGDTHSWHLFIIQINGDAAMDRNELVAHLKKNNIGCSVHYRPLHQMTLWSIGNGGNKFPNADAYFEGCISLPLFMDMSDTEQDRVIDVVSKALLG
ncbi:spore coat protein [Amylibacter ulvae]|uniref:Spore coat protein n=2 Tax=Paramylibacter ulvae TaxID=1651968 RepID=A0ABQ3D503_9RHOB|nr:spore coat protein [Amylibacter ulvae]